MEPTPYRDVNTLIEMIQSGLRGTLGEKLVGLYVFGSLVMGTFEEETSDVDLLAALATDLSADEFERVGRVHGDVVRRFPRWDDRIEIGYISVGKLRRIEPEAEIAMMSPGEPFHFTKAGGNWPFNLYTLLDRGVTVLGPPPQTLIDPISTADLVEQLRQFMLEWRVWITKTELIHQRQYQGYMVITMCRNLYLFRNGAIASKREAAAWAASEMPEWAGLIRDAFVWREVKDEEGVEHDATLPDALRFVHFVIDTILSDAPTGH